MKEFNVKCSNCEKELVHVIQINDTQSNYKLKALCPHCGDHSFLQQLSGRFHLEGINCNIGPVSYNDNIIEVKCLKCT